MKFKRIKWKNLLSYGNKLQTYEFSDVPELILIEGENGSGKSSIKEALTISAFGKSAIRKMKDLPNWINKNAYTYNEFETSKGDIIVVERGIDPNFSQIKINGVSHNLPDKRKIDEFIENELLGLNFSIFCNTISLSFDDFKSFVNLSPSDKRKIIDPIFGIDILTDMRTEVKEDLKENKKNLEISDSNITKNGNLLESTLSQLDDLRKKLNEENTNKTLEIETQITEKTTSKEDHRTKYNDVKTKLEDVKNNLTSYSQKISDANARLSEFNKKLKIYENNKCPHCLSDLTGSNSIKIKEAIENKKKLENDLIKQLTNDYNELNKSVTSLTKDMESEKKEFYEISADIKNLQDKLESLKTETSDTQEESMLKVIETIKSEISKSEGESSEYRGILEIYDILDDVLSDKGIKKFLIDKVIPILNSRITEISDRLDFKFNFQFDNEFNPIIQFMGMEVSPESLSTGQRKKMNLIVLLSFIEIIKMKHTNMNVMFLDEIFSGLDKRNVHKAIEILREYADKYNMTIFVVSHESLPEEFFDKKVKVEMKNHFSDMTVISNWKNEKTN